MHSLLSYGPFFPLCWQDSCIWLSCWPSPSSGYFWLILSNIWLIDAGNRLVNSACPHLLWFLRYGYCTPPFLLLSVLIPPCLHFWTVWAVGWCYMASRYTLSRYIERTLVSFLVLEHHPPSLPPPYVNLLKFSAQARLDLSVCRAVQACFQVCSTRWS